MTAEKTYAPDNNVATLIANNPDAGNRKTPFLYQATLAADVAQSDLPVAEVFSGTQREGVLN